MKWINQHDVGHNLNENSRTEFYHLYFFSILLAECLIQNKSTIH